MKKALLAVVLPFVLVAVAGLGLYWWDHGALPGFRPRIVDVTPTTISRDNRGVRLRGTAHYAATLKQKVGDETYYLFPLFPERDTTSRTIRVMVRTRRKPDPLYTYGDLTVEGLARPPGSLVPGYAQDELRERGYDFAEGWVLVLAFDDEAPAGD